MNLSTKYLLSLSIALSLVQFHTNAKAAESDESDARLEEIIVTATRRVESIQDVAMSVSAYSGETLDDIGAQGLGDYFGFVPSVNVTNNSSEERGGQNIIIRGIANARLTGTDSSSLSSTTGFYLNDVPVTPVDTQIFDINRVEALRGPQGTLYGAASMGGAVKLYHNAPDSSTFEAVIEGTAEVIRSGGSGGGLNAMVNIPIIDGVLAARFVGTTRESGGYIDTMITPLTVTDPTTFYPLVSLPGFEENTSPRIQSNTNSADSKGLRAAVLWTPTDRLSIETNVMWQKTTHDHSSTFITSYLNHPADSSQRLNDSYFLEPSTSEMSLTGLDIEYDFGPVSLYSLSGVYQRRYEETIDSTLTLFSLGGAAAAGFDFIPALGILNGIREWKTFTQEIRLQSNFADSSNSFLSRTSWVLGAFYLDENRNLSQVRHAPGWGAAAPSIPMPIANDVELANTSDISDKNEALFADVAFDITDRLTIAAGIRYFDQSTDQSRPQLTRANPTIPDVSVTAQAESGSTPKLNVSFDLSDDLMVYGTFSEGFRLGGATMPINLAATPECAQVIIDNNLQAFALGQYGSDNVRAYEAGLKSGFGDGRVTMNASVYQTEWSDMQQQVNLGNFPPPNNSCSRVLTANIGSATVDGYEVEVAALLSDRLYVQGGLSYTDAQIDEPGEGVTVSEPGDRIPHVPDWAGSLIARYTVPINSFGGGDLFFQGDVRYMGERAAAVGEPTNPALILDPYTLVGLRAGVTILDESITVTLFVRNVLDEIAKLGAGTGSSQTSVTATAPRTAGITVSKRF